MNISLFFGSFNPIHNGHLNIANYIYNHYQLDEIWLVLSPQNPLKEKNNLLHESQRLLLIEAAIKDFSYIKVSTVEFDLPKPSYTYLTLRTLKKIHPNVSFSIIMGSDAIANIKQWKNYQEIIDNYIIYIYPRSNIELCIKEKNIILTNAPTLTVSSTDIRKYITAKKPLSKLVPEAVNQIIVSKKLYQ